MNIAEEAQEIVSNARAAWRAGEISLADMLDICRSAERDVFLAEIEEATP